jgi:DNA modification methylase
MSRRAANEPARDGSGARGRRRSSGLSHLSAVDGEDRSWQVLGGDCLSVLAELPGRSVDAVVCDPPYGINLQGRRWDGRAIRESAASTSTRRRLSASEAFQEWTRSWAEECLEVLKPGGHLLAFGSPRTFHRLACGLEDAGLEIRDTLMWLYASGMAKSRRMPGGRGTSLKPAWEPIMLARRRPEGSVESNLRRYGTGTLNIDACRIGERWPANVLAAHHERCSGQGCAPGCAVEALDRADVRPRTASSQSPPSRLFFCSKVTRAEREAGCEQLPAAELNLFPNAQRGGPAPAPARNPHPTVKPIELMRWLVRLGCPARGVVLDPFCGSGSTGIAARLEGCLFLGIERESDYVAVARARISHWTKAGVPKEADSEVPLARACQRRR